MLGILVLLSGCNADTGREDMPYIEPEYPPLQHNFRVTLYYADEEGNLSGEIHLIDLDRTVSPEFGVIDQLIDGPSGALLPVVEDGVLLNHVYIVQDTAYVDVTLNKSQPLTLFTKACAQTLHEAFDVTYLVLTVDGHMPQQASSGVVLCTQQKDENPRYIQLFFPDTRGQYIISTIRHVTGDIRTNTANAIFDALMDGPSGKDLSEAMDDGDIVLTKTQQAGGVLNVYLRVPEENHIDLYGYACLAMSMIRNIQNVNEVMISVNGDWVGDVPGMNRTGSFTLDSMADIVGGLVELYFAGADGTSLVAVTRSVTIVDAANPLTGVREIIRGPLDTETGILNVLPAGVQTGDVISLERDGGLVVLDLSASFYMSCKELSGEAEKLLLYSIVNALTQRPDIRSVLFMNEGTNVQTLSGIISLERPLLRNPGLIVQQ